MSEVLSNIKRILRNLQQAEYDFRRALADEKIFREIKPIYLRMKLWKQKLNEALTPNNHHGEQTPIAHNTIADSKTEIEECNASKAK